mmetsp:Transcript_23833/g.38845  ORF Transcript_23833/g.38845 Transcript_23833/m.38845 type:complete len:108 (+) Transcript_23833:117-440(+)
MENILGIGSFGLSTLEKNSRALGGDLAFQSRRFRRLAFTVNQSASSGLPPTVRPSRRDDEPRRNREDLITLSCSYFDRESSSLSGNFLAGTFEELISSGAVSDMNRD